MEYALQNKIYLDKKQLEYLGLYSQWYKELNRSANNYQTFLNAYKKYRRELQTKKLNGAIDTLDTVNSIFKIIN